MENKFKVFPIKAGAKAPPLWSDWPNRACVDAVIPEGCNVGIHCEGLLVIDVDVKKGGVESFVALAEMLDLPETREHSTPTGGRHVLYRLPEGHPGVPNSVEALGKGLDIRSTNGYIVAPGSVVPAGDYTVSQHLPIAPAPDWLVRKLGTIVPKTGTVASVPDAPDLSVERARQWLMTAERSVKGQGGDQAAYRVACKLRDLGVSYAQACELMRSEAWDYGCGWRGGRLEEKPIASAYRYAQNEDGGSRGVVEDDLPLPQAYAEQDEKAPVSHKPKKRSRLMRADAFAAEPRTGHGYVVKNLLNRESYAVAFGSPGAGKTFVALDLAYHVANSKPWMGLAVRGGPVLYLAYEGVGGLKKRAQALQKKHGADLGPLYIAGATMNLRDLAGRQELGAIIAEMPEPPVLVIVDTFARALMGGDENSAQDVGAFNDAIAKLIDKTSACVLLIHHSGKNKAAGARGSSAILGAIDTELEIEANALRPSKQRDLELIAPIPFKLVPVVVGVDIDGEEEKSCIVEPSKIAPLRHGLKGDYALAFTALGELCGEGNDPVPLDDWRRKLADEGVIPESGRTQQKRFYDVKSKLEKYGYAAVENGMVNRGMR
jgi:hypothetical protein